MIDGHVHLEYGPLEVSYVMEFVNVAKEQGISAIQILDHTHRFQEFAPLYERLKENDYQRKWLENKNKDSLEDYHKLIREVKMMDLDIQVQFGLEVCYAPENEIFLSNILTKYPYDFLVGAIHSIDGLLYDMGFSKEILWSKHSPNYIYKRYYELIFELIESKLFTQLAHPDTIKMFDIYPDYNLEETYQRMAQLLNQNHMKAENNTGAHYRYHHSDIGLSEHLLRVLNENRVSIITASDAHFPKDVGKYIFELGKNNR